MKRVVTFSGGIGSWLAARRVVEAHGTEGVTLLFCDTKMEDEDLYRFLHEAAQDVGVPVTTIADGRTPWEVFRDERFIGNSRVDPCSKILKRELMDRWVAANCDPADTVLYFGIDWSEIHRFERLRERRKPWVVEAPLCEAPYLTKDRMFAAARARGMEPPRLYALGFSHNNCGGFCVKAGHAHFARLLEAMPERYAFHEAQEELLRAVLGGKAAIMNDRSGTIRRPLTMREFRERIERAPKQATLFDPDDFGGCGCAVDDGASAALLAAAEEAPK